MPEMNITVRNKIATKTDNVVYVCDNSDYVINFDFDSEWDAYDTKTARFDYDGKHTDVVFTGNQCNVPIITNTYAFHVGVFGGDLHTTTAARVPCRKSILSAAGAPADPTPDVYDQIMEIINGLGSVDPDDIAKAVADYLAAHPIEETDPTVPEWAKAETKPTYSAAEVGAIAQSDLQAETNAALAQAKASGEFDGPAGPQGPAGTPGKDGAGMDVTGATVGQIAKIAAVDESGVPTAWSPVDMPGGGGGGTWKKIIDTEVMEATPSFTCDGLNCNEIYIRCSKMENATGTNSTQGLYLNNTLIMSDATIVNKSGGGVYGWTLCRNNGIAWVVTKSNGAISELNLQQGIVYAPYNLTSGVGPATTLKLDTPDSKYAPITGKLEVWVR